MRIVNPTKEWHNINKDVIKYMLGYFILSKLILVYVKYGMKCWQFHIYNWYKEYDKEKIHKRKDIKLLLKC